jgi:hypothetical protein
MGQIDMTRAEEAEVKMLGRQRKSWRKIPDMPLGEMLAWKRTIAERLRSGPG